jgi:hypothetical protein
LQATPVHSYAELIELVRARIAALGITHEGLDHVSGLQSGYTGKLLARPPIKRLGPISWDLLFGGLGLAILVVEDPEQMARIAPQLVKRQAAPRPTHWRHRRKSAQAA